MVDIVPQVHASIRRQFPNLSRAQLNAIAHVDGPLLIIAGPGSGKTQVLVLRALNILLHGLADPREIVLCTFTDKAAFELRDRISSAAKSVRYVGDLSQLQVGTIHGISNDFVMRYRHHTHLGNGYRVLDDLSQLLFLNEHFDDIFGEAAEAPYLGRWNTRWSAIKGLRDYLNKITEELIDPQTLNRAPDPFIASVGEAYKTYQAILEDANCIDFAHQQKLFYDLLMNAHIGPRITENVRFVLVDEYQDTNYIQEQLLLQLAHSQRNICVVGDEDQALYRFRGATVRNILEFGQVVPDCTTIELTVNYRSHRDIVDRYNRFMQGCSWTNRNGGPDFRYNKTIQPDPKGVFPGYPAVFSIWGQSERDEAVRFADMVAFLKEQGVIEDFSQVALLLRSVRIERSGPYIQALEDRGIPAYCPRARGYFENEEVRLIVACYAILLGYHDEGRGDPKGQKLIDLAEYVDECLITLAREYATTATDLLQVLRDATAEIHELQEGETLDRRLADYFYRFVACEPFAGFMTNENRARNLAIFSQLIGVFQTYYHFSVISHRNRASLRHPFFGSFLRLLHDGGINEYEDPDEPFPKGHVQIMTIHQSKGLEFPVVVVGSLAQQINAPQELDRRLGPFMHRALYEPPSRTSEFDRMRLHYVAFSRAEKILVLTSTETPKPHFRPIWQGLDQWPYVRHDVLGVLRFDLRSRIQVKKSFSFTADLKVYETCPRQYQFFRHLEFQAARSAEMFFGALVHQTIEDIHRWILEGQAVRLVEAAIPGLFDDNFRHLVSAGMRPIGEEQRRRAFEQVMNYFRQNRDQMQRVIETEVDVSVEKDGYILTGKIDLVLGDDDKLELLDFKSQPRPVGDNLRLRSYYLQLCTYAHILEQRYGKRPDRLLLYWTGEDRREDALMVFPYDAQVIDEAGRHFDQVVGSILTKDFRVKRVPETRVCKECDFRRYCSKIGTISINQREF